jgi:hypothetical protein
MWFESFVSFPYRGDDDLEWSVPTISAAALPTGSDVPRLECRRRDDRLTIARLFAPLPVLARTAAPKLVPTGTSPPRLRIVASRHAAHAPPGHAVLVIEGRAAA